MVTNLLPRYRIVINMKLKKSPLKEHSPNAKYTTKHNKHPKKYNFLLAYANYTNLNNPTTNHKTKNKIYPSHLFTNFSHNSLYIYAFSHTFINIIPSFANS